MSLPPRTRVRKITGPGQESRATIGVVAPPEAVTTATVRWDVNHLGELEEIRSATEPIPGLDWVVVWWPGNYWTWELVAYLELVPDPDPDPDPPEPE